MIDCRFCRLIEEIKNGDVPNFVAELATGYVLLNRYQLARGYALFISKQHVHELHEFSSADRELFLHEMALVAEAVYKTVKPVKLNYELMGNSIAHAHWHIIPRHANDLNLGGPYWCIEKEIRESASAVLEAGQTDELKRALLQELRVLGLLK